MMTTQKPIPAPDHAQTQAAYDRLSRWYDLLAEGSEGPWRRAGLALLAVQPGENVLEIGCGTGGAFNALTAAVGAGGWALGLDVSRGMLAQTQRNLTQRKPPVHSALLNASGAALPLPDGCLDAIFMSFTLELFAPPLLAQVLGQCARVLRPDGRLGVVALTQEGGNALMRRLYAWAQRAWPTWIDCRPLPLRDWLVAAGWHITRAQNGALWGLPVGVVIAHPPDVG